MPGVQRGLHSARLRDTTLQRPSSTCEVRWIPCLEVNSVVVSNVSYFDLDLCGEMIELLTCAYSFIFFKWIGRFNQQLLRCSRKLVHQRLGFLWVIV